MSVSSGSDVTIPIQDSPPPPPSPYGNKRTERKTPEPRGDVGIDNAAFEPTENDDLTKQNKKSGVGGESKTKEKGSHTQIPIGTTTGGVNGAEPPLLTEALNSELINMNIMNTIPDKPQTEFGPYENPDEYFIAVNQHKKFLRSEKLYVTKDKRKVNSWKKYICWLIGACILLSIVTIAILAGLGLISQKTPSTSYGDSSSILLGTTTSSGLISSSPFYNNAVETSSPVDELLPPESSSSSSSVEFISSSSTAVPPLVTRPALSDNHVPAAADITLTLDNAEYAAALNNKSSDMFRQLADQVEQDMRLALTQQLGLSTAYAKVMEFLPGSVVAKMRISWMDDRKELQEVQMFMAKLRQLGPYQIRPGATTFYALVNHCKFRNYGCSHFCTFDYEQLDFLCTCPELLRLAEDDKTCIENVALSSSTANIFPLEDNVTEDKEAESEHHHQHEHSHHHHHNEEAKMPASEPPLSPQSISTEETQLHVTSSTTTTQAPIIVPDTVLPPSTDNNGTATGLEKADSERTEPLVPSGDTSTTTTDAEHVNNGTTGIDVPEFMETVKGDNGTEVYPHEGIQGGDEEEKIMRAATPAPVETTPEYIAETFNETEGSSRSRLVEQDAVDKTVEEPTELAPLSPSASQGNTSEEESSAPLQRSESDNYSEVEQRQQQQHHQEQEQQTSLLLNNTTTTTATPIVSFNSSRYSEEERNILSEGSSSSSSTGSEEAGATESVSLEGEETLSTNASTSPHHESILLPPSSSSSSQSESNPEQLSNGTRHKSARLESYGEEPLSRQLDTNGTARSILTNSAEFMIYGDNVISPNPTSSQDQDSGGLEDDDSSSNSQLVLAQPSPAASDVNSTGMSQETVTNNNNTATSIESSASVESLAGESGESVIRPDSSASIQQEESSPSSSSNDGHKKKTGLSSIIFRGAVRTTTPPTPGAPEEYTTVRPFDLENDTLVNENATEDRSNSEPVILQGAVGEQEISVETTPFTAEQETRQEGEEEQTTNAPSPVPQPTKEPNVAPAPRELEPTVETTLPPVEETTIVLDDIVETTMIPLPAAPANTSVSVEHPAEVKNTTSTAPTSERTGPAGHEQTPEQQPATDLSNNQLQQHNNNPSDGASSSDGNNSSNNNNNNRDRTGPTTADNENELS